MREIGTSSSMSGDGKRGVAIGPKLPRPSSTLPRPTVSSQAGSQRAAAAQAAGRTMGQQVRVFNVTSQDQFDGAFATMARDGVGALLVTNATLFTNGRDRLVVRAPRPRAPARGRPQLVADGRCAGQTSASSGRRQACSVPIRSSIGSTRTGEQAEERQQRGADSGRPRRHSKDSRRRGRRRRQSPRNVGRLAPAIMMHSSASHS